MAIKWKSRAKASLAVLGATLVASGCVAKTAAPSGSTTSSATTSTTGGTPAKNGPGVTATQITIGAISTSTGQLAGYFNGLAPGMIAYFDMLNATGGINGRKIVLPSSDNLDDGGSNSQFIADSKTLINQDHVFAVGISSPFFTPSYFTNTGTPTYGYNVSGNWQTSPNLFAAGGSTQDYAAGTSSAAWFMKAIGARSVAFISYSNAVPSSYDACTTYAKLMHQNGYDVTIDDSAAPLYGQYQADVQRIAQSGAQLVISCMQASDNITFSRDVQQYSLHIKQLWLNGYDQTLLNEYQSLMSGVYINNTGSVPFEVASLAKYKATYPGMDTYINAMQKYEPTYVFNGIAFQGWQSAALIAAGIKAAGNDLSQQNLIAVTNKITNFTAGGLSSPVDWTNAHTSTAPPYCNSFLQVQGKEYVPVLAPGTQVFVCVGAAIGKPAVVTPPAGTPGA